MQIRKPMHRPSPPPGRLRSWPTDILQYFLDTFGQWSPLQSDQYVSALWLEVDEVRWTPEQRLVLEDVFQEVVLEFVRDFPIQALERVDAWIEAGADGAPPGDRNDGQTPKQAPRSMPPRVHANRFLKAMKWRIADALKRPAYARKASIEPEAIEDLPAETADLEARIDAERFAGWFEPWARQNIANDQYIAFCLRVFEGRPAAEVASQFDVAEATVRSWVFRIRNDARTAWAAEGATASK